ncbi:MAG: hypothetical protein R3D27_09570 [Hyphomicrobiaceae bacterium]
MVFTRYNTYGFLGLGDATELNGYAATEIIVCSMDGEACEVLVPPRNGVIAANAYWTPDGRHLLYVSSDTPNKTPGIRIMEVATRRSTVFFNPKDLIVADPHQVGQLVVLPGRSWAKDAISSTYVLDLRDGRLRQVTHPKYRSFVQLEPPLGDYDPKLSPDGRQIVVMRRMADKEWHSIVVDVATGRERDLTPPGGVDGVPEWSSDGQLIIFWHVDLANLKKSGLYVIRPDGSGRQRVPLPGGNFYTMPAFFPGDGSGPTSRIIWSRKIEPAM